MQTLDFIESLRADVKSELKAEILAELKPEIERLLYNNVFDLKGAALYRKVSESTIRRMVHAGEIPYFMQREQYFFRQIDLDKQAAQLTTIGRRRTTG